MEEIVAGTIERITFHNPENGFCVLRVQTHPLREPITVVGAVPSINVGERVEAQGQWTQDREHGRQFKAERIVATPPNSLEGIEKYLGSGLIRGIGPHFAKKIVQAFGQKTLEIIDESPAFLQQVRGIGPTRLQQIRQSWSQQRTVRSILIFLQEHGVGTSRAVRIYKTYGDNAIAILRENPYRLAEDIWGIGFQSADTLALRLAIEKTSPFRARAALLHVLQEMSLEGHCGCPEELVLQRAQAVAELDQERTHGAIAQTIASGDVVREESENGPWLFLRKLHSAELGIAAALGRLLEEQHPMGPVDVEKMLSWVQERIGMELAPAQRQAIRESTRRKVLVVTGGPGVGKTTIVRSILEVFAAKGLKFALAAPTGRAAKRLAETTERPAKTIHRLLDFDPINGGFKRNADQQLKSDLVIVDEVSMVDVPLMHHLLAATPSSACLILVGDVDQLPSVGPGTVLADLISSRLVHVIRLTEIFRQAGASWIVRAAHAIKEGRLPESAPAGQGDFFFVEANDPEGIIERVLRSVIERIPAAFGLDPLRDVQVLTPMNRTDLGSRALNVRLQEALNPRKSETEEEVQRMGWTFRVGDKVLQTTNNYTKEVYNGDIGRIAAIDSQERMLCVDFEGRGVTYEFEELDELALAYALTIHKSQGSEYPAIVIPLHTQHYVMLQRNLLYTAITRGKKLVVVIGSKKALGIAVGRRDASRRYSRLRERLQALRGI